MTAPPLPLRYEGDGEFRVPSPHWGKRADAEYVVGEVYRMAEENQRSTATHNHEFAWVHDAWLNLPENLAPLYPSSEHLRKRALIDCGFYDEQIVDAGSNAAALRVAAAFRARDDFLVTIVRGPLVINRSAKSQSRRAMKAPEFQASKSAILELIAGMIHVEPETLLREAGRAA